MSPNELSELAPIAATLNQESNEINGIIVSVNSKLASMNLGIEVWCDPWDIDIPMQIGFAKVEDGKTSGWELAFRLCNPVMKQNERFDYEELKAAPGNTGDPQSLLRATRNVRIEALAQLPNILQSLKAEAERKIQTIQEAKKIAAELAAKP